MTIEQRYDLDTNDTPMDRDEVVATVFGFDIMVTSGGYLWVNAGESANALPPFTVHRHNTKVYPKRQCGRCSLQMHVQQIYLWLDQTLGGEFVCLYCAIDMSNKGENDNDSETLL